MSVPEIIVDPNSAGVTVVDPDPSVSVLWDQAVQAAVIAEGPGPTIASRAYAIVHTAIFEAWAAYDPTAVGTAFGDSQQQAAALNTGANKAEAMSYAAFAAASGLFPGQQAIFDDLMVDLGYTPTLSGLGSVAQLGVILGTAVADAALTDGANQAGGYADTSGYSPVNADPESQTSIIHWTPEYVPIDSQQNLQSFLTPHWGGVKTFAPENATAPDVFVDGILGQLNIGAGTITLFGLEEGARLRDYRGLRDDLRDLYRGTDDWPAVRDFIRDVRDNVRNGDSVVPLTLDIIPKLTGPIIDRRADLPSPEPFFVETIDAELDLVTRTVTLNGLQDGAQLSDYRALRNDLRDTYRGTEDWRDVREFLQDVRGNLFKGTEVEAITLDVTEDLVGAVINSDFIAQAEALIETSANLTIDDKRVAEFWEDGGGTSFPPGTWMTFGQFVSARDDHTLDQDAQLFFALANAVQDAGIATWGLKAEVDYARPVAIIRDLGELGLIGTPGTDHLGQPGQVIEAWAGPGLGTQTILVEDFITYQNPFGPPSPPFAEYTSGHSSFSAAGAEILRMFTGSDAFGGSVEIDFTLFEPTPNGADPTTLDWATFSEAADEAGLSRIYGAIHFDDGDLDGRALGREVGENVWDTAQSFIQGTADEFILV
ncbi:MAG: vanadium-dependent haloperoxidase [Pseudomonadota bacterium]